MNWYIYWHFAVEEYCDILFTKGSYLFRRFYPGLMVGNLMGWSILALHAVNILVGHTAIKLPFIIGIGFTLPLIDYIIFNESSKRYSRWQKEYKLCTTDNKEFSCFLSACIGFGTLIAILVYNALS